MTLRAMSFISGISETTLRRHIRTGMLAHGIDPVELYTYCERQWNLGRVLMWPPEQFKGRVEYARAKGWLR